MSDKKTLLKIYGRLLKKHGHQGWWPIQGRYNLKNYDLPRNKEEQFEICLGAILTQNTSWKNVEKALAKLQKNSLIHPKAILKTSYEILADTIRSSGYYNQKAKKLKEFSQFYQNLKPHQIPTREQLLTIWGIGEETADSILLYTYKQPYFVVDAYTKRLFKSLLNKEYKTYQEWQHFFHTNLLQDYKLFNEFHALIVAEGKILLNRA